MLPPNFSTAIKAAMYLTALATNPESEVNFTNQGLLLQIDNAETEIPPLNEVVRFPERRDIQIGNNDLILKVNPNGTFGFIGEEQLIRNAKSALRSTGFTPTHLWFGKGHRRNLKANSHLFDDAGHKKHLDSLEEAFPKQTKQHMDIAREADVTKFSQTSLDVKLASGSCLQIPISGARIPYSYLKRAGKLVAGTAALTVSTLLAGRIFPQFQQALEQTWQLYQNALFNHGFGGTMATNCVSTSFFYGLGDVCGQYIEGNLSNGDFDRRRLIRTSAAGAEYGIELTGLYWGLNKYIKLPSKWINSAVKAVADVCGYGYLWFNNRHIHLMEKEDRLKLSDFLRQDKAWEGFIKKKSTRDKFKMLCAYGLVVWIPYQTWNRVYHADQQQVGYVCAVVPPFTVFLSLVANEKRKLTEFVQVMELYKSSKGSNIV